MYPPEFLIELIAILHSNFTWNQPSSFGAHLPKIEDIIQMGDMLLLESEPKEIGTHSRLKKQTEGGAWQLVALLPFFLY